MKRRIVHRAAWIVAASLIVAVSLASDARAMCCLCRDCNAAAFCVDGLATSIQCSTFCFNNGCPSTVFVSDDTCAGGCDGAPVAPTATPSSTSTQTPTTTASATATGTNTVTGAATATVTATASASETPSATATSSATGTVTETPAGTTPTATPSVTPTVTGALAGHIRYYAGAHPPVADADVFLFGTPPDQTTTDADGNYSFSGAAAAGDITIQPAKNDSFDTAITSLDAVTVLQAIAGGFGVVLTPDQQLAADASGNGSFSTLDAAYMLQFQAGIIDRLPSAEECQSDWLFVPEPSPTPNQTLIDPVLSQNMCQMGAIQFMPFTPPLAGRDFRAILIGDVTGNWTPATPTPVP